ncbi:DUF1993 domain-containing protein [Janthinobacterium sp. 17J80-10]|uniref:DUF1993 domain-containing protein n=1 Tax=Janthinobacterium sp. 17J80-10 TaxID=2497863 RepID=UPI0010055D7D|nr:DUF1993 domain-containing protein [Janthinobacterium sp. 17J80-10]QAU33740.1 DUF1993 domain-containing protein [Janthinobacterium sp. 17J80-10]
MSISMYAASVPLLKQILQSLDAILGKAESHASARKIDPAVLLQARLYPDMFPLVKQVQIASDNAKGIAARLAGVGVPSFADTEQTFAELQARIAKTLDFINAIQPEQVNGSEARDVVVYKGSPYEMQFQGQTYLIHFGLPNFLFHVTTAYAILRHNGVEIGKDDFIGKF